MHMLFLEPVGYEVLPERLDELIEIIQRNAKDFSTLIGNIRDVTKLETQTLILNME